MSDYWIGVSRNVADMHLIHILSHELISYRQCGFQLLWRSVKKRLFWRFLTTRSSSCPTFILKVFLPLHGLLEKSHTLFYMQFELRGWRNQNKTLFVRCFTLLSLLPADPERFYLSFQCSPNTTHVSVWAFPFSHLSSTRVVHTVCSIHDKPHGKLCGAIPTKRIVIDPPKEKQNIVSTRREMGLTAHIYYLDRMDE